MRKPLEMTIEWVTPEHPERCIEAMTAFLASCVAPGLHRAVADTPVALAAARRVLAETEPEDDSARRAAEIAELKRMKADLDRRLSTLQAAG